VATAAASLGHREAAATFQSPAIGKTEGAVLVRTEESALHADVLAEHEPFVGGIDRRATAQLARTFTRSAARLAQTAALDPTRARDANCTRAAAAGVTRLSWPPQRQAAT